VFTDVVGSTPMRARLGEEAADQVFRDLERLIGGIVADHAGRVISTGGDGVMAAFDSATDAVRAMVAIQQCVTREVLGVDLRVGGATGDVSWQDGNCQGMPVVTAARLGALAEGRQILVGPVTRWLAGERSDVAFKPIGMVELKGIPDPVEAFEIPWTPVAKRPAPPPFTVPLPAPVALAPLVGFVGRQPELAEIDEAWQAAQAAERRAVLIGGEAGAGKTRLAFEYARRCADEGAVVLLGVCDAELAVPYQPWVGVLDQLTQAMPAEFAANLADDLAAVSVLLPQVERLIPGTHYAPATDPELNRYRLFQAIDAILSRVAHEQPMVVLIDDLHWASAPTLALLRHLARSPMRAKLLIIGTFRDTGDEMSEPLAGCLADLRRTESTCRVRLGGLAEDDVARFIASTVRHVLDPALASLSASLAEHTAGNAFYVGELWRHLVSTGVVGEVGGRWTVRSSPTAAGVPDGVREVVAARFARRTPDARRTAELIAVAGLRVELRVIRVATGDPDTLGAALDELLDAKLLVELEGAAPSYQFAHAIVRDTIEQGVPASALARLHHKVGQALEAVYESDRRPVLAELARHFVAAAGLGDADRAVYYARRAADQAMRSYAYDQAIVHLDAALALTPPASPEHVDILLARAEAGTKFGLDPTSMEAYHTAYEQARSLGLVTQAARAVIGLEDTRQLRGLHGTFSVGMITEVLALVDPDDTELRMRLRASLVQALHLAGRLDEARRLGDELLSEAKAQNDPELLLTVMKSFVMSQLYLEPANIIDSNHELCRLAEDIGDLWTLCWSTGNIIRGHLMLGQVIDAKAVLERQRRAAAVGHYDLFRYQVVAFDAVIALIDGRFADAERCANEANELFSHQTEFGAGVYGLQMYALRREQGRLAEVAPILRAVAAAPDQTVWRPGLAALYADMGMLADARRELDALGQDNFAAIDRDSVWPASLTFVAEVCSTLHDTTYAETLYRELDAFQGLTMMVGYTACFGPADRLRGTLAAVLGRRNDAEAHFRSALEQADRSRSPVWRARVCHDWAVALGNRPDLLDAARAIAVELGMTGLAASPEAHARPPTNRKALPNGLSTRELEVLRLVAAGRSNREIGERLLISQNTAANHVRAILQKTGASNRAEATAYAARHGLLERPLDDGTAQ
jgi:DNA-binding CsgD family transcriptional regulator